MCVLDCSPSALKILHSSPEFMPYVIFIGAPGMETLKQIYAERKATGGSQKNLAVSWLIQEYIRNDFFVVIFFLVIIPFFCINLNHA